MLLGTGRQFGVAIFSAHYELLRVGATAIELMTGTIDCVARTALQEALRMSCNRLS